MKLLYCLMVLRFGFGATFRLTNIGFRVSSHSSLQATFTTSTRVVLTKHTNDGGSSAITRCADHIVKVLQENKDAYPFDRIRQHVNPLALGHQQQIDISAENLLQHLDEPITRPIVIDIGCAEGNWDFEMAKNHPHLNFLGLEIRLPAVRQNLKRKLATKINNVHFLCSNANIDLGIILKYLRDNYVKVDSINIQFPDPQFKKRLYKRRVVNPAFVTLLAKQLDPGTRIFMQSDVLDVGKDMVHHISECPYFTAVDGYDVDSLDSNKSPYSVQTEREKHTLEVGEPVYRMLYMRNDIPYNETLQLEGEAIDTTPDTSKN